MTTREAIETSLATKYDGRIDEIRGFSYIPWNESVDQANRIFGSLGWSSEVKQFQQINSDNGAGFLALVRVTIHTDEGDVSHDGIGFSDIQTTNAGKDLLDTAVKAAASDALSRAFKLYGDAFGLFLYDKEEKQATSTAPRPATNNPRPTGGGKGASEKQVEWLQKKGIPASIATTVTAGQAKTMLDGLFAGDSAAEVLKSHGFENSVAKQRDDYPIPA